MVTYILAAEAIAVIPIGRHLWLLLTKEITGSDTTNVATGKMVGNLNTKVGIAMQQRDLWTQFLGVRPNLITEWIYKPENFLPKNFSAINPTQFDEKRVLEWKKKPKSQMPEI